MILSHINNDYNHTFQSEPDKTEDSANKANKANTTPSKENRKITNDIVNTNNKGKPQKKETASGETMKKNAFCT